MSFSVSFAGRPDAVKRALVAAGDHMSGQSRAEFDAVRPSLDTLLDQNVGNGVVQLDAHGHASVSTGADGTEHKAYGTCSVSLKTLGAIAE